MGRQQQAHGLSRPFKNQMETEYAVFHRFFRDHVNALQDVERIVYSSLDGVLLLTLAFRMFGVEHVHSIHQLICRVPILVANYKVPNNKQSSTRQGRYAPLSFENRNSLLYYDLPK